MTDPDAALSGVIARDRNLSSTNVDSAGLQMSLPAKAENVAVVRHAIAGLAEQIGMDEAAIADLKTVVTEACMNVVVHAYPEDEVGLLEIEALPDLDGLTVAVRDFGRGISPRPGVDRPSLRIGLALIAALSSSFEIRGGVERGTEIRMHLPLRSRPIPGEAEVTRPDAPEVPDATEIQVGAAELLGPVLSRALTALAARQEVTVDRISDAMLLADAISAAAPRGFADGQVKLSIADRPEGVELKIGPMEAGAADGLRSSLALPDVGGSLETLADEVRTEADGDGEYLVVGIAATAS
ncbi:MAG TPA: ATP-binding protein [Solirubrobacterales bacterium]|nr:ATP-binding protein [Solirubrobacterales bacterium]